jgi:hypothetical protein
MLGFRKISQLKSPIFLHLSGLRCGYGAAGSLGLRVRIATGHGFLSVVSVVCCQVAVSATS